jgi:GTP-binding protein
VFIGRSNSGKSSLINSMFHDKTLARVSRVPGTTKYLHFHSAKLGANNLLIVDAPGYGYAKINKAKRLVWAGLIDEYLKISSRLSQIFLCINFEHGIKSSDIYTLKNISKYNVNIQLVLNKADRVKEKHFLPQMKAIN